MLISAPRGPIRYAGPAGLVAVAAWVDRVRRGSVSIRLDDSVKSRYAWNTGLLGALVGHLPSAESVRTADNWFPLCGATDAITEKLSGRVSVLLKVPGEDSRAALAYMISEMVRNVDEHAFSNGPAFFAAGWFQNQRRLCFAVGDGGIGLRGRLAARRVVTDDDDDAIVLERAMQPHVSGASPNPESGAPGNAGMGLYMTRGIVRRAEGRFTLLSHGARFVEDQRGARFEPVAHYPGTVVEVTLYPDRMPRFASLFRSLLVGDGTEASWPVQFGSGPREALLIGPPVDTAGFAANKTWYASRRADLLRDLQSGEQVVVDFQRAGYTTQSALHALLFEPLRLLGPDVLSQIWFSDANPQVRMVVRQVVAYALDYHLGVLGDGTQ